MRADATAAAAQRARPPMGAWQRLQARVFARGIGPALPAFAYLVVFLVLPLGFLFSFAFLSVERGVVQPGTFSLEHFAEALSDPLFWKVAWRSFWVGTVSTLLCLLLGYPLAYLYTQWGDLGRRLLLVAVVAPLLTSAIVRAYAWMVILGGRYGLVNSILIDLGLIGRPLRILNTDVAVIIGMTQIHLPFMILPLIAALAARDPDHEHASLSLGASRVETFLRVTLPLSIPGITAGCAIVFALSYTNFIIPQLLGGGNYATLALQVYEFVIVILDWTKGAVRASLLLASCFVFVFLITWIGSRAMAWSEKRAS
jgi:ABC-type spermidine/putrescine transport system permease subunit I